MARTIDVDAALSGRAPAAIAFAAAAWPLRAAEELRSAAIFRAARAAARRVGEHELACTLVGMVRDELGHVRLCTDVGARLGAPPPQHDLAPVAGRVASLPEPRLRLAAILLVEAAMGESVSMALFRAGRKGATEPLTRAALGAILSDEVRHARAGWEGVTALWPSLPDETRQALQREAQRGFASMEEGVRPALLRLERGDPFDPALAELGVLAPEVRVETFYDAIEGTVIPRLTALGVDGPRAWAERYRP